MLLTNGDTEVDSPPAAFAPVIELAKQGRFAAEVVAPQAADKDAARSPGGIGGLAFTYPERLSDEAIDHYLGPLVASAGRRALADAYAAALAPNPLAGIGAALGRVGAPTRIVWGTADAFFSPEGAAHLDRVLPNWRGVRAVPGAKLFFPEEHPDLVAEEARALWSS